jgi:hypothetical protein
MSVYEGCLEVEACADRVELYGIEEPAPAEQLSLAAMHATVIVWGLFVEGTESESLAKLEQLKRDFEDTASNWSRRSSPYSRRGSSARPSASPQSDKFSFSGCTPGLRPVARLCSQ